MTAPGGFAPAPPHGPGVQPPFPAPPVEGKGRRLGLGLGVGAGVLVLVCGGGLAALVGLVVAATEAFNEQAEVVVGDYFDAVAQKRYDDAYDMLCQRERDRQSEAAFTGAAAAADPIRSYRVGAIDSSTLDMTVPVDVTYENGRTATVRVELAQDQQTAEFEVCGVAE